MQWRNGGKAVGNFCTSYVAGVPNLVAIGKMQCIAVVPEGVCVG